MLLSRALPIFIAWLQFRPTHQISNYVGHVIDVASDCPGKKHASISKYFDPNNIQVDWTDEGYIVLNGYTTLQERISPDQKIHLKVAVLKKVQGQWVESLFGIERKDGCPHLMDPNEPWHALFDHLEGDQKKCPPEMGVTYPFNNKTIKIYATAPSADIEGDYKFVINIDFKEGHLCTFILVRVNKLKD